MHYKYTVYKDIFCKTMISLTQRGHKDVWGKLIKPGHLQENKDQGISLFSCSHALHGLHTVLIFFSSSFEDISLFAIKIFQVVNNRGKNLRDNFLLPFLFFYRCISFFVEYFPPP